MSFSNKIKNGAVSCVRELLANWTTKELVFFKSSLQHWVSVESENQVDFQ
jgi:hypothetical protein